MAATGLTLARWLTWEPYSPIFIPYDLVVFGVAIGVWFSIASLGLRVLGRESYWEACAALPALAVHPAVWVWTLKGTAPGDAVLALSAVSFLCAGALGLWQQWRGRHGLPLEGILLASGVALALSVKGYESWKASALLLPTLLPVMLAFGVPKSAVISAKSSATVLGAGILLLAVCASSVYPASGQWVPLELSCPQRKGPSVILIVLDTLRRDHMSLHGYSRKTTPFLDQWSEGALVFDDAVAVSSWTLPSHASMFTGLYPRSHGADAFRGQAKKSARSLSEDQTTAAEIASAAGICTAAILSNWFYLGKEWNLDQGFGTYWAQVPRTGARFLWTERLARWLELERYESFHWLYYRDRYITDEALRWLRAADGRQFFLVLNYMDVHTPNRRPPNEIIPL
ncbi:MAG: sulfatase-like hydrolase/transferase, partial [Candidatus Binatia bacterium]